MSHAQEAEYLAQLRKQQAKGKQQSKSGAPKANKKHSDDGSTSDTSSVDTHLDDCDICDDGGDLLCCDGCEKAYHPECLHVDEDTLPDVWYGPCCENRSPVKTATPKSTDKKNEIAKKSTTSKQTPHFPNQRQPSEFTGSTVQSKTGRSVYVSKESTQEGRESAGVNNTSSRQGQMQPTAAVGRTCAKTVAAEQPAKINQQLGVSHIAVHITKNNTTGTNASAQNKEIQQISKKLMQATAPAPVVQTVSAPNTSKLISNQRQPPALTGSTEQIKPVAPNQSQLAPPVVFNNPLPQFKQPSSAKQAISSQANNKVSTNNTTNAASKMGTFRTVVVPAGVSEGSVFHVLLEGGHKLGVVCPMGVRSGQTMIVMEPGCFSAPITPEHIVEMNEARLVEGFDAEEAKYARRAFWEVLFPQLEEAGWSWTRETNYNFGAYKFTAPFGHAENCFVTIVGILKSLEAIESYKSALHEYGTFIKKLKEARRMEELKRKRLQDEVNASPEKKIRVGSNYQVRSLPRVGSYEPGTSSEHIQQQVWKRGETSTNTLSDLYDAEESNKWKEWAKDPTLMDSFHQKIIEYSKELSFVSAAIGKPIGFCLWYYYNKYKTSGNYQALKAHLKKLELDQNRNSDECMICDDGGELLCCDTCPNAYHPRCLGISSTALDGEETWSCPVCTRKRTESCRSPAKSPMKARLTAGAVGSPQKPETLFVEKPSDANTQSLNP